ncbi:MULTISPECIES: hypothetical protein [Legionella]|uniref:Uncharacterized protein n=1 Tax=Legionella resiliens TaxID=2905958 RepID=A0ABS8X0W4_9GAMM|nr:MULTISPECIES: hypothetical protein [unclassified Legionella]MCE0723228.1 hypothetical protein [Legionella sp. 9fVS26]MCE3532381.1 hypothetical protein [Legionella sp. 8cVS16]QLZ68521.1 hypothetical protein FOLKNPGA_01300 [Legionella sp. PC1000]
MRNTSILSVLTTSALTFLLLNSSPAYAYLDPGTGSVILQGIIGAITAGMVILRIYWHRLLSFLGFRKNESEEKINE